MGKNLNKETVMRTLSDEVRIESVRDFVRVAFVRKFGESEATRHIEHAEDVASILEECGATIKEVLAGHLHDVPEDTDATFQEILELAGDEVLYIVEDCTDLDSWRTLSTIKRKLRQANRIRTSSLSSNRVKLADQTSNLRRLMSEGPPAHWPADKPAQWIEGAFHIYVACQGRLKQRRDLRLKKLFIEAMLPASEFYGVGITL